MEQNSNLLSSDLQINGTAHNHLLETAKWAKFLGIVGFVISALLAIMAVFAGSMLSSLSEYSDSTAIGSGVVTGLYLLIAVIYFFLSLYLYRFAVKMKAALLSTDPGLLSESFLNLKLVYRILGIITIIYIAFLAIAMIIGIGAVAFMGSR